MKNVSAVSRYLDPLFGIDGVVHLPFPRVLESVPSAVCSRRDKKLLLGIRAPAIQGVPAAVARLDVYGQLDMSFAEGGVRKIPFSGGFFDPRKILSLSQGGAVITGNAVFGFNDEFAAVRLLENGQIDTDFGETGTVIIRPKQMLGLDSDSDALAVGRESVAIPIGSVTRIGSAVQEDGKLLLAGTVFLSSNYVGFIVRLNNDGTPDESFNGRGCVLVRPPSSHAHALTHDVAVQSDGLIVVCGQYFGSSEGENIGYIARFDKGGQIDLDFGREGGVPIELDGIGSLLSSLALSDSGGVFASGQSDGGGLIVALNWSGSFNLVFNNGKPLISSLPGQAASTQWSCCHLLSDGSARVVVTGSGSDDSLVTARYLPSGVLDPSYADVGWTAFDDLRGPDVYVASTLTVDSRVVVCGTLQISQPVPSYVLRYNAFA